MECSQGQSGCSVTKYRSKRGGEETPILSSPQFLVCTWSGACQHQRPVHRVPPRVRGRKVEEGSGREGSEQHHWRPGSWVNEV